MVLTTLGGGCFWCLDAVFQQVRGVQNVVSGYAGGREEEPSYEAVKAGSTGHAEVVQISYDPAALEFQDLLQIFFEIHDPTTLNRQGEDIGTQYRSIILHHNENQAGVAREAIQRLDESQAWPDPIVTEVGPMTRFWPAEEYHQNYFNRNPKESYCQFVIGPKVEKFQKVFMDRIEPPEPDVGPETGPVKLPDPGH